jgi:preprotein translocase subunit SecE
LGVQVPRALLDAAPVDKQAKEGGGTVTQSRPVRSTASSGDKRTSPTTFYRQVVAELRKVVWPSQQQLITYFVVVLVFVLVVMTIVSLLDLGFGRLVFKVFG